MTTAFLISTNYGREKKRKTRNQKEEPRMDDINVKKRERALTANTVSPHTKIPGKDGRLTKRPTTQVL